MQDLNKTYKKAEKDRKAKIKNPCGFPQKKKHSYCSSVRFQIQGEKNKTYTQHWQAGFLFVPSIGLLPFRDKKSLPLTPPNLVTVSRNASGQFHVSFLDKDVLDQGRVWHDLPEETLTIDGKQELVPSIDSVDMGLRTLGTTTKKEIARQRYTKKYARNLRKANKLLARKQKGSSRYHKAKLYLGKIHVKIANCRKDYIQKAAQDLVKNNAILCLEDLTLKFMLENSNLARDAHDASLGTFKKAILWNAQKYGHLVIECGRFDPSSKTCSLCGHYYKELGRQEYWTCQKCNTLLQRDENAAVNIRVMALEKACNTLKASGNDADTLSVYKLHPKLITFLEHGGLASLLRVFKRNESRAEEVLVLPQTSLRN